MTGQAATRTGMTVEEYLDFERRAEEKHEFLDGEVFAMSGGTRQHSDVASNIIREIGNALRRRQCWVNGSDMRVKTGTGLYTYPDASVVCGDRVFEDERQDTLLNPSVVIEVLSESTEAYDRGKKFEHCRSILSLTDYVLASQKEVLIEHFTKQSDGSWVMREARAGDRLVLASIECEVAVDDLYLKVFDELADGSI